MSPRQNPQNLTWGEILKRNPRERLKAEKDPLKILDELPRMIKVGYEAVPEDDLVRLHWFGICHDKPKRGRFMIRIRVPRGRLLAHQVEALGKLAKTFGNYAELTTRQNIQLHSVQLDDIPEILSQLNAVDLTTLATEGDTVRTITRCPVAGLDAEEHFDCLADIQTLVDFFSDPKHKAYFHLPRKVKLTLSACRRWCNLPEIHDIAFVGIQQDGQKGYGIFLGGGLSTNPRLARSLDIFVPRSRVLAMARTLLDVWSEDLRSRRSFVKARLKFFVDEVGIEWFRDAIMHRMGPMEALTQSLQPPHGYRFHEGCRPQKDGLHYYLVLPVVGGRLTGDDLLALAELVSREGLEVRLTQRQNLVLTHIPAERVPAITEAVTQLGYPVQRKNRLRSASIACTGDPFCNFAAGPSKEVLIDIINDLEATLGPLDEPMINLDGCPHSCAQHWIGDIGLQSTYRRTPDGRLENALMIILGGGSNGRVMIGRVVAKRVSISETKRFLINLIQFYRKSGPWASFQAFVRSYTDEELLRLMEKGDLGSEEPVKSDTSQHKGLVTVRMGVKTWRLPAPIPVREVIKFLEIPTDMLVVVKNGVHVQWDDVLQPDDEVELIRNISGG